MAVYVMSDIHGLKSRFDNVLAMISLKEDDQVYVLGDVIDRGKDGIEILQYIMKDPRFTLLMGNHELMMLDYYESVNDEEAHAMHEHRWGRNGCIPTMEGFDKCTPFEQEEILNYIKNAPLAISDLVVNDKMYYLVHGAPIVSLQSGNAYLHSDFIKLFSAHDLVWNRINGEKIPFQDRTLIVGHTITSFYQDKHPYEIWCNEENIKDASIIDIDCGCASNNKNTQLACLRLDDLKVFYG